LILCKLAKVSSVIQVIFHHGLNGFQLLFFRPKKNFDLFFNSKYYTGRLTNNSALTKVDRVLTKT